MDKPAVSTECMSQNVRRKYLTMAISTMLVDAGFDTIEKQCLETLCEMFQSLLFEIGESSRSYCELACRTTPVLGDVVLALINMGLSVRGLEAFAKKIGALTPLPAPQTMAAQKQAALLSTRLKENHPPHIPSHFPALPDSHAYIRTPTHKQPVTEYEAIRERAATQRRDVEKALTKFLAKTSETQSLFGEGGDANQMFPLIAATKPHYPAYLAALNPTDQVFDFEELEYHYLVANRVEDAADEDGEKGDHGDESKEDIKGEVKEEEMDTTQDNSAVMDNPFIKALGM